MQAAAFDLFAGGVYRGFVCSRVIVRVLSGVAVPGAAADALVTAGAKCPAAVFLGWPVASQQHCANIRGTTRMVQRAVKLIHRVRAKCIAHLGAVKSDADDAIFTLWLRTITDEPVIGNIRQVLKALDGLPELRLERIIGAVVLLLAHGTPA